MPSEENDVDRTLGLDEPDAEAVKLNNELKKLNALQYLLDEDAMEELDHDVAVMKADVAAEETTLGGVVKRRPSINVRLKEFQDALRDNKLFDRGRKLKALVDDKKLRQLISAKKKQLDEKLLTPRFIDRCAFFAGIMVVCVTEYFLLRCPELMYIWYTVLIFPLMAIRFAMYHKLKFHYFMLDFCYLCQFLLLFYLFVHQYVLDKAATPKLFKLVFALSNGPLAWGAIVWKNKLVFHDVDKLTSSFIHLCPPLVTYCLRWFSPASESLPAPPPTLSLFDALWYPMVIYVFWQFAYYMKTEVVDRTKLKNDTEIMTSSRWMTVKEPHPIYKWCVAKGYKGDGVLLLMLVQMLYTPVTLLMLPLLYQSYWLHTFFLWFVFFSVLWEGATYYFEIFTEAYQKRLEKAKNPVSGRKLQSLTSSTLFFCGFVLGLLVLLKVIL